MNNYKAHFGMDCSFFTLDIYSERAVHRIETDCENLAEKLGVRFQYVVESENETTTD